MTHTQTPLLERTSFLAGITGLGGFLDAYTYMTRGGVFANNHTGNMAKLGIELAKSNWYGALDCLIPIIFCVLGAVASEWTCSRVKRSPLRGDWRKFALLAELAALFIAGLLPASVPNVVVNTFLSFVTGFQLCLFRSWEGAAHNTTICTGNLRSLGQYLFGALSHKERERWFKFLRYACLVFSFAFGATVGAWLCGLAGGYAVWFSCGFLLIWIVWFFCSERKAGLHKADAV